MEDEKADAQPETAGSTSLDPEKPPQEDEEVAEDHDTDHVQMAEVEDEAQPLPPLELASMSLSLIASTPSPLASGAECTRGCEFSPDGLCVLLNSDDNKIRLYELPKEDEVKEGKPWSPCLTMREGETVYDLSWFPGMTSADPETCCFAATAKDHPVHLYDAFDGHIRASYRCFNHLDEMVSAQSVAFDAAGDRIYAGLTNEVRVFDVSVPGKECDTRKTWKKKSEGGQKGIVSCIATHPTIPNVYAVGTYRKTLGLYLEPHGSMLCLLTGQSGGITHIRFTADGTKILAGGRKDPEILVWDVRNPGQLYSSLRRKADTNQRIQFDVSPLRMDLVGSANTDGTVAFWELSKISSEAASAGPVDPHRVCPDVAAGGECVNGFSFHPFEDLIATSSGQRHYSAMSCDSDGDDSGDSGSEASVRECAMKLWKMKMQSPIDDGSSESMQTA